MPDNVELEPDDIASDEDVIDNPELPQPPPKRSLLSRFGCGFLLVIWFVSLLTPCALLYLASNGEIRFWHSDIPDPHSHPRLLIELISEIDYRGLRIVNSSVVDEIADDDALCVQTDVRYLLWETAEDNQDVSFCDCYAREISTAEWSLTEPITDMCPQQTTS